MATIRDVARLASVSCATVSHVLNRTRAVLPGTRSRVLSAVRRLDYVPSAVAQSLKQQSTRTVGLVIPNTTNPWFAELARAVEDACFSRGHAMVLCSSDEEPERQEAYLRLLRQKRVDGIVIASLRDDPRWVAALHLAGCPLVVLDRPMSGLSADVVRTDCRRAGALAAEHLKSLGHRRIGCIAGPAHLGVVRDRLAGLRRGLAGAGIALADDAVVDGGFTAAGGHTAALALVRATPRPTALFALNDLMAIGALRALSELGLRAPADVSVLGFDGIELGRYVYPAVTTVAQPTRELGARTVELVLERARNPGLPPRIIMLPPAIVVRESTGTAAVRIRSGKACGGAA